LKHGRKELERISLLLEFNVNTFSTMNIWRFSAVAKQTRFTHLDIYLDDFFPSVCKWFEQFENSDLRIVSIHSVYTRAICENIKKGRNQRRRYRWKKEVSYLSRRRDEAFANLRISRAVDVIVNRVAPFHVEVCKQLMSIDRCKIFKFTLTSKYLKSIFYLLYIETLRDT